MFVLIAVIASITPILGFVLALGYFVQYRQAILAACLCGFAAAAAFYGYQPDIGNDINRHMANLALYQNIPIYESFDALKNYHISALYTWDIWSWIVAQLQNPYLLQSSAAFIGYTNISYMIFDQVAINKISLKRWLPIYFIALTAFPMLEITVGIRSANAYILCALALYLFFFKGIKKIWLVFLLLIALLLHHSAIVLMMGWALLPIFVRFPKVSAMIIFFSMLTFNNYSSYINVISGGTSFFNDLAQNTLSSAAKYNEGDFNDSFHAIVTLLWRFGFAFLIISVTKHYYKNLQVKKSLIERKLIAYSISICIFSIALTILIGNNGLRYIGIVNLLSCFILINMGKEFLWSGKNSIKVKHFFLVVASVGNLALYLYDMSWGTASLNSFFVSMLTGYFSRSL